MATDQPDGAKQQQSSGRGVEQEIDALVETFLEGVPETGDGDFDVSFKDLDVIGAGLGTQTAPTVATASIALLQTLNPAKWLSKKGPPPARTILNKFSGTVRGGEMLLVVGPPSSGCTTFLKIMANMRQEYHAVHGDVRVGADEAVKMKEAFPGEFAFAGEDDVHFSSLSVGTTLRFAVNARTPTNIPDRAGRVDRILDGLLKLFRLSHTVNTAVGNDYHRGVSGGERHRVTVAEALSTRAGVICLDNPTRGLDSASALRLMQTLRSYATRRRAAVLASVPQASDAMLALFDKVLVINAGREVYFGSMRDAPRYFADELGLRRPPRTSLSDYLTAVSVRDSPAVIRADGFAPPRTPEDFEAAFARSAHWKTVRDGVSRPPVAAQRTGRASYALPLGSQILACTFRQTQVHLTDLGPWIAEAMGLTLQALILGTLYWDQPDTTRSLYTRGAALFFNVLVMALQASAEYGNTFAQRGVLLRHSSFMFYRPGAYAVAQLLADAPWKILTVLWQLPTYWMAGFRRDAGAFFTWFVVLYVCLMSLGMVFRAIAVNTTSVTKAILPVGLLINVWILYTGFYVTAPGMKVWLGWLRYLNPMYYAYEGIVSNELSGSRYRCSELDTVPFGAAYNDSRYQTCAVQGFEPGATRLNGDSYLEAFYGFSRSHLWRNFGIIIAFFIVFSAIVTIGMERFKVPAGSLATVYFARSALDTPTRKSPVSDVESQQPSSGTDDEKVDLERTDQSMEISEASPPAEIVRSEKSFSWKDLCLDVKTADGNKRLLNEVSGHLKPGSMTALMGMSGAGKTTLLNTLSQRAVPAGSTLSGSLHLGGASPLPRSFKRRTGFVHQQDVHLATSTVREALTLAATLRQPSSVPASAKAQYVDAILSLLDMRAIADAVIGMPGSGLNLEQRKRVSIGVELAARPDVLLFLDEPTSGLDGGSAARIVRLLRRLSTDAGLTVLCTIHQPAAELIREFDDLLLLVPGGRTAYVGPLGEDCGRVLEYFGRHTRRCGESENPAEYFLGETVNPEVDWPKLWEESSERAALQRTLEDGLSGGGPSSGDESSKASSTANGEEPAAARKGEEEEDPNKYAASLGTQLRVVTVRAFTNYWRDPDYVLGNLQLNLWMALMNGLTFLQLGHSLTDARNHVFSLFVAVITGPVISLAAMPRFAALRDQFLAREKDANTYRWPVFVASAAAVELPWALLGAVVYWLLWYYAVGFPYAAGRAAYAFLMYVLYTAFVAGLSQFTSACFPTVAAAQVANGFVWLIVNTFNGPLSPPPLTPRGWRWIYNVSPLYYFIDGMASNAVHGQKIVCAAGETSAFFAPDGRTCGEYAAAYFAAPNATGYLVDPAASGRCEYCQFSVGDEFIRQYEFSYSHRADNVGIFIGFIALNFVLIFAATYLLYIRKWKKA